MRLADASHYFTRELSLMILLIAYIAQRQKHNFESFEPMVLATIGFNYASHPNKSKWTEYST